VKRRTAVVSGTTLTVIAGVVVTLAPTVNDLVNRYARRGVDAELMKECICELYDRSDERIRELERLCTYGPIREETEP
jgi:hypothetical protein